MNGEVPYHDDRMNDMSWSDLWDQHTQLYDYTGKGIDLMERIVAFAKERTLLEQEYATKLKALSKKSAIKMKNENELWGHVSYVKAYQDVVHGLVPIATQHETIAESLKNRVVPFVTQKISEYKSARKQADADNRNINLCLQNSIAEMQKSQKEYGKAFKESEAAMLKWQKAEQNMELSRLDLDKTKRAHEAKTVALHEHRNMCASMTEKANGERAAFFEIKLPSLLENYRLMHRNRIHDTKQALKMIVEAEENVDSIIASCHRDMHRDIEMIDSGRDSKAVIEYMKSGHQPPAPYIFEDLGSPEQLMNIGNDSNIDSTLKKGTLLNRSTAKTVTRKPSVHQRIFGGNDKKAENGDYGSLPPQQRARKISSKIAELERDRDRAVQSREGVCKMQAAYRENPKLGNPNNCTGQLTQYAREIDDISNQIQKYRIMLDDVNAQLGTTASSIGGSDTPPSVRSVSSASSGVTSRVNHVNETNGGRRGSFADSEAGQLSNGNGKDELYEECAVPSLGEATALFHFAGDQEGTIRVEPGEQVVVVEKDEGDGWTRVRRQDATEDGFVPSTYLKITFYDRS